MKINSTLLRAMAFCIVKTKKRVNCKRVQIIFEKCYYCYKCYKHLYAVEFLLT